jgi:hypothetical protein
VPCEGVARDVALAIGMEEFTISCFGINLGGFDLILGVEYLRTLGPILWDLRTCAWPSPAAAGVFCGRALALLATTFESQLRERSRLLPRNHCWTGSYCSSSRCSTNHMASLRLDHMITTFIYFQELGLSPFGPTTTHSCRRTSWNASVQPCSPKVLSGRARLRSPPPCH